MPSPPLPPPPPQVVQRALGETDSLRARFAAAMIGGVMTSLAGTPFDVAKTRMMNEHITAHHDLIMARPALTPVTAPTYPNMLRCMLSIVRIEGPLALWKGLLPVYVRNAPFTMASYLLMESLTLTFLGVGV